jgi:hypothetical protein
MKQRKSNAEKKRVAEESFSKKVAKKFGQK